LQLVTLMTQNARLPARTDLVHDGSGFSLQPEVQMNEAGENHRIL